MQSPIPLATYRLQFNHQFTLQQAIELIDYWQELGITDLYASPLTKAKSKSLHGYDVIDHNQINPEIGTEEDFARLASLLKDKGMGFILDIVPNHMCIADPGNNWWRDVLENGPSSIYAGYFDITWDPPKLELKDKILLPILTKPLGRVIEDQELKIVYQEGAFFFDYNSILLPLNPKSWSSILKLIHPELVTQLKENDEDLLEFESILTALDHLPDLSERDPEKCKERNREKEIIKKRLSHLLEKNHLLQKSIQMALAKLNGTPGDPASFNQLELLLKEQAYRLSYWRLTNDLINYRRFFDINDLACLHMEKEEVLEATHSMIFKFIEKGWVTGLRIDHIDGLYNPQAYLKRLQEKQPQSFPLYVIVEKILVGQERLNPDWLVAGTTGYDYLNLVNGIFVVPEARSPMQLIYDQFIGYPNKLSVLVYECKKLILLVSMASELYTATRQLEEISEQHRWSYDYALEGLRSALRDVIACFPVYRTYINQEDQQVSKEDQKYIFKAITFAKRLNPASDHLVFDFIKSVLMLEDPPNLTPEQIRYRREFVLRLQQLTGPVMAKGFEDTALYRAYPLLSLNDVGMDAAKFGLDIEDFHAENQERAKHWPHTLSATSTHDTKRSEDVRARINVLSEIPKEWKEAIERWQNFNKSKKVELESCEVPDANEEYLLYQTLIGSWPCVDLEDREASIDRIRNYMIKALKEAKIHTSWINPNEEYEQAVLKFIDRILDSKTDNPFLLDFQRFIFPLQKAGMLNSLSQLILKMTTPGIPDFYQGSELWQLTLVDPDNRQPVEYGKRQEILKSIQKSAEKNRVDLIENLSKSIEDGRLKMFIMWIVLNFRKNNASLFQEGKYIPLEVKGEKAKHIVAFSRTCGEQHCLVLVSRFFLELMKNNPEIPSAEIWRNTFVQLPTSIQGNFRNIFDNHQINLKNTQELSVEHIFQHFPFAVFEKL